VTRVAVPEGLHAAFAGRPEADPWIRALPVAVEEACETWRLSLDLADGATPWHGVSALVVPVRREDGQAAALKITWPHPEATHEALGLRHWAGDGVVRLLETDGAWTHLLERLDAERDLSQEPIETAVAVVADLLGRLHAVPAPPALEGLALELGSLVERWQRRAADPGPVPSALLQQATALARDLLDDPRDGTMLHCDLHYANVLAATREPWLAIDPKPRSGDPAYEVAPLLWNRFDEVLSSRDPAAAVRARLEIACDHARIDVERAVAWTLVREVQNAYWAAEVDDRPELAVHLALAELLNR
jgi:streptomycin 6-kinase